MADQKLSALTNGVTSPGATDRLYIVDGIGGTPAQKYIEYQNLKTSVTTETVSKDQTTPQTLINGNLSALDPTSAQHIATKNYVDNAAGGASIIETQVFS